MDVAFWRDVALVILAVEATILGLVPLVALFFAVRGLRWLNTRTREYTARARDEWQKVHRHVERTATFVRTPFERVEEAMDTLRVLVTRGGTG